MPKDVITKEPYILTPEICMELLQRIETIIQDTCLECGYDIQNIRANNWNYILHQIALKLFSIHPELIRKYNEPLQSYDNGDLLPDNMEIIYDLIYAPLCDKYNQIIGQQPFCKMLAINAYGLFKEWERRGKVTSKGISFRQKFHKDREQSLRDAMISSPQNPVKFLAIGNHEFAWNEAKPERIEDKKPVLSLEDLPELEGIEMSDNLKLPELVDSEG